MKGQQKRNIIEMIPPKFAENENGYEVVSNDSTVRLLLRHVTVMNGGMESEFYYTVMYVKEDGAWVHVNNTQNYRTKEEFINAISAAEEFTEAVAEFNNQKQQ